MGRVLQQTDGMGAARRGHRFHGRGVLAAGAAMCAVAWAAAPGARATIAATVVSQNPSPYATAGCQALDSSQVARGSIVYTNSEEEPWVAVDPTNSSHLVGAFQQDRWSDGGSHGLVASYSNDGGRTWSLSPQPFSACYHASGYGGPYLDFQRSSDPWVSIGPGSPGGGGSTVYSVSISFDNYPYGPDAAGTSNAVGAAASYDGGRTWSHVQPLIVDPCQVASSGPPGYLCHNAKSYSLNDKESVTADPTRPGTAYAVWDRVLAPPAAPNGFVHERAYSGDAMISTTHDYGQSWSTPHDLLSVASQNQTIGNLILVDPRNDTLYDLYSLYQNSNADQARGGSVAFSRSVDGGTTWSGPTIVASEQAAGVTDAANADPYLNAPPAPIREGVVISATIDPADGQLYVAWNDSRFSGGSNDEVVVSTSSDAGSSWSPPALLNVHTGQPAFVPTLAVDSTGTLAATYYQWQAPVAGNEPTNVWIRRATSPGSSSAAPQFAPPSLVAGPFNTLAAPYAYGYFLGDYQGLVPGSSGFVPYFVKTNCSDGSATVQPSCRALASVLSPTDPTATGNNSTDVYAAAGS